MNAGSKRSTDSGIEIKTLYTVADQKQPITELPGEYPYTRGVQPDMYRGRLWTMRQYAGFSTAEESNKRYHYLLEHGVNGLSAAAYWKCREKKITNPCTGQFIRRWFELKIFLVGTCN